MARVRGWENLQQTDLHAVHGHGGQVVGVLLVPAKAEQRVVLRVFIDDGTVLQVPEVKHADGPIGPHRGEHISAASRSAEGDVVHLRRHTRTSIEISLEAVFTPGFLWPHRQPRTSLSWAISWVFTCPDTRLTRPNTWPVSSPQMVQVVSMLEVPAGRTDIFTFHTGEPQRPVAMPLTVYRSVVSLPSRLGSTSFQSKDVSGAQKSEFLLLFSKHSRRVSVSPTCAANTK